MSAVQPGAVSYPVFTFQAAVSRDMLIISLADPEVKLKTKMKQCGALMIRMQAGKRKRTLKQCSRRKRYCDEDQEFDKVAHGRSGGGDAGGGSP